MYIFECKALYYDIIKIDIIEYNIYIINMTNII